ncbi:hypothetical protein [Paracoccus beibuensis]|uniref:hypothetical protein n=1 Tax=Paracoccus beibuensis TaxID=547602 RepID=UPI00223FDDD2|nr:hypothetical protein [Paracoccus beibuensis]
MPRPGGATPTCGCAAATARCRPSCAFPCACSSEPTTRRDASLRKTPELDAVQGRTRIERATRYAASFRTAALARGIVTDIALTRLPGVSHDVAQALTTGGLARTLCVEPLLPLARAS